MQRNLLENILKYGMLLLCVSSVGQWLRISIGPTLLWWTFNALMIWALVRSRDNSYRPFWLVVWVVYWSVSSIIGTWLCRDYWDWKLLIANVISYSICITTIVAGVPELMQQILGFLYRHLWKLFIVLVLFMEPDGISKFMLPFSFLALLYPILDKKYKRYVWGGLLITLVFGIECRTDVLKFLFCSAIGLFSVRHSVNKYIRRWYWVLYLLPFLFFILAANGTFNIFNVGKYFDDSDESPNRMSMADTRTFLYEEVITNAQEKGTVWFGVTPARGYFSEWFAQMGDDSDVMGDMHYGERGGTESSVLNVFLHFGVVGLFIYLMLFWNASYLAIFKSNNIYIPIIGLYVAFRFLIGWVEDFTRFDLNMFFLWMMVGMCYSPYFRDMSDDDFSGWINNILL